MCEIDIDQLSKSITKDSIIVCIGTDKCIGDCLGPLVGTLLEKRNFKLPVYGTLDDPIHANNIYEKLNMIKNKRPNSQIISIDACLGAEEDIGKIKIRDQPIFPGKGVGKDIPGVGDLSIIGTIDKSGSQEIFFVRSMRLSFIVNMAEQIVDIIEKATKDTDQSSPR